MGLHHQVPHMEAGFKNAKWWHNNCFSRLTTLNGWHWSCCSLMTKNRLLLNPRFEELVPIEHRVHFFILFAKTPILLCRYFHYLNQQASSNMFWFLVQIITKCSTIDHKELKRHLPVRVVKCCICLLLPDFQNGAVWLLGFKSHTLRLKSSCSYWLMLKIGDGNNSLWELPSHVKSRFTNFTWPMTPKDARKLWRTQGWWGVHMQQRLCTWEDLNQDLQVVGNLLFKLF